MAEYRLSPAAERDLEGIWKYTRGEWRIEQAERYTDLLTAAFRVLAESPKSAPACDRSHYLNLDSHDNSVHVRWLGCLSGWVSRHGGKRTFPHEGRGTAP
jgi:plasmid stabilization system protein ParE